MSQEKRATPTQPLDSAALLRDMIERASRQGRTKYAFAKAGGMDESSLNRYLREDGPKMTTSTLTRVAEANGFSLSVKVSPFRHG